MKSFLVIGMILAHALQLLSLPRGVFWLFSVGINLITFSGFFFCFGYVFQLVYLSKPANRVRVKMAKTAWKTLLGYYLSALASLLLLSPFFVNKEFRVTIKSLTSIITLSIIPWYSEFLLAFFLITVLILVFFDAVNWLLARPWLMAGICFLCLLTACFLPVDLLVPNPLALFVGTRTYAIYPIVQYLPIFFAGLYFARFQIVWHWAAFIVSLSGTLSFGLYFLINGAMPPGFLPSIYWLVGSFGILYGYFLLAKWLERQAITIPSLLVIGQNSLLYLLLSNLILFALTTRFTLEPAAALGVGILVIAIIGFLSSLVSHPSVVSSANAKAVPLNLER